MLTEMVFQRDRNDLKRFHSCEGEMENLNVARRRYADLIRQTAGLRSDRLVRALSEVPRED